MQRVLEEDRRTEEMDTGISTTRPRARTRMNGHHSRRVLGRWGVMAAQEGVEAGAKDFSNCKISIWDETRFRTRRNKNSSHHSQRSTTLDSLSRFSRPRRRTIPNTDPSAHRHSPRLPTHPPSTLPILNSHRCQKSPTIPTTASTTSLTDQTQILTRTQMPISITSRIRIRTDDIVSHSERQYIHHSSPSVSKAIYSEISICIEVWVLLGL